jgi:NifU-like protein involved in Fe-S cluster formation
MAGWPVFPKSALRCLATALQIKPQDILKRLGGLPDRKIHCSVLGDKALRAALNDWFKKIKPTVFAIV